MKRLIAVAVLLIATTAQAQTSSNLSFGDLNYFFKKGEFNLAVDANVERAEWNLKPATGASTNVESEAYVFRKRLAYGLADNMHVTLGLNYVWESDYSNETTTSSGHSQDGLMNPELGFNYRLMNQNNGGFNLDFGLVGKFMIEDEKRVTTTVLNSDDGNAARGNHAVELNTRLGHKWNEANEWQLAAGLVYNMEGEYTENRSVSPDYEYDTDSSMDLFLRATYQWRPVQEFMMAMGVTGTRYGDMDSRTTNLGVLNADVDYDSYYDFDFTFTAKYLITDKIIAKFNYGQSRNGDIDISSTTDSEIVSRRNHYYGLGVDFLF